jgi:NitT/TauT family transport system substrate-binding protein
MTTRHGLTRRQYLTATGAGALAASLGFPRSGAAQAAPIRQGYQTNVWGMPTYYLLRSGALEKRGLRFEEFAVPSGNLTMQQMVARQVDLGTYAGPSFILGHDKGGMIGLAVIEHVGRTTRIMARRDLNITRVEQLKGLKIANQTGSSIGNIFVDQIAPAAGLARGDWQEVRMDVNNMVAALAARTVDAMVNVEPYNAIAEAEGIASTVMDYWGVDRMPVFMAATPEFVAGNADRIVAYLKAWLDVARDFKERPDAVADAIHGFYAGKGYNITQETFRRALSTIDVDPGFPSDLNPYMQRHAEVLLREKKIAAIPDWSRALRPEFMERARTA